MGDKWKWDGQRMRSSPVPIHATHHVCFSGYVGNMGLGHTDKCYAVEESEVWVDPTPLHQTSFLGPCLSPSSS